MARRDSRFMSAALFRESGKMRRNKRKTGRRKRGSSNSSEKKKIKKNWPLPALVSKWLEGES